MTFGDPIGSRAVLVFTRPCCRTRIVTEVVPVGVVYDAESYHQQYLEKGGQSAQKSVKTPIRLVFSDCVG
jgi:peptide methionine sulfoxide reductase MsrA